MNIIVGSYVWVEDPAVAWIEGQVTKIKGNEAVIQRSDTKEVCFGYLVSVLFAYVPFAV